MKILEVRLHSNLKKADDGRVQVHVGGQWRENREFSVWKCWRREPFLPAPVCLPGQTGPGRQTGRCEASGIGNFEFVQVETDEDREAIESTGVHWYGILIGDIFRRCKACGHYNQTGYRYPRIAEGGFAWNGWPARIGA